MPNICLLDWIFCVAFLNKKISNLFLSFWQTLLTQRQVGSILKQDRWNLLLGELWLMISIEYENILVFRQNKAIVKELSWSYSDIHVCNDVVSLWSWTHWHCLLSIPLLLVKCSRANSYHLPVASIGIIYTAQGKGGFLLIASSLAVVSPHMCSVHRAAHKSS